ncbi:hypothetical protein CEUSTIGMA_g3324.t1 [Chlamydomonas eustigma]|uniref:Uncharacterized protein n=1 Tax=Chlamydomonas eustigma TaxID=1157962 RepID=A0A250WYH3_9CHLO|nr:hypothetical protein CEUSTIGMA_g3324.t1 [Chlamydomonas eustigma]|eukprot:GAX75881.1 hypothetical protein CEUSTIGMA_g3324.t1 [Chlamydomonas eustigma]
MLALNVKERKGIKETLMHGESLSERSEERALGEEARQKQDEMTGTVQHKKRLYTASQHGIRHAVSQAHRRSIADAYAAVVAQLDGIPTDSFTLALYALDRSFNPHPRGLAACLDFNLQASPFITSRAKHHAIYHTAHRIMRKLDNVVHEAAAYCPGELNQLTHRPLSAPADERKRPQARRQERVALSMPQYKSAEAKVVKGSGSGGMSRKSYNTQHEAQVTKQHGEQQLEQRKGDSRGRAPATNSVPRTPSPQQRTQSSKEGHQDVGGHSKPKEHHQLLVRSEDMVDRDMLGYIMRAPYHYRVAQFYTPASSPFRRHRHEAGRAQTAAAGVPHLKAGQGVGQGVARTAVQEGLHTSHIFQMAHEISQVGRPEEGRAVAEAAAAAAAAAKGIVPPSTPNANHPQRGAATPVPGSSAEALGKEDPSIRRVMRLAQALELIEHEQKEANRQACNFEGPSIEAAALVLKILEPISSNDPTSPSRNVGTHMDHGGGAWAHAGGRSNRLHPPRSGVSIERDHLYLPMPLSQPRDAPPQIDMKHHKQNILDISLCPEDKRSRRLSPV